MTALLTELMDRIGDVIELDATIARDRSGRAPDTFDVDTLYVFPDGETSLTNAETGPPSQEFFRLIALFVADAGMEEARLERTEAVTDVLSSRRDDYMMRLASVQSCDLWDHIEASVDADWSSNFEGRAIALHIVGYRFLT